MCVYVCVLCLYMYEMYMVQILHEAGSVECFSFGSWLAGEAKGLTSCLLYMHVVVMCGSATVNIAHSRSWKDPFMGLLAAPPTIEEPFQFHF